MGRSSFRGSRPEVLRGPLLFVIVMGRRNAGVIAIHPVCHLRPRRSMQRVFSLAMLAAFSASPLAAQSQTVSAAAGSRKATLAPADYAKWETLGSGALSPDGKWVAYDFRRGNNTTELRYRAIDSEAERTVRSASNPQFSNNGRWLLYTVSPDTAGRSGGG